MAVDRLTQAVRHQLGLGRLLPLGGAEDGAWLTEEAAVAALRSAVAPRFPGVRLSGVRLDLSDPGTAVEPAVPPPPSALDAGQLRLEAELSVPADEPLPALTASLRHALLAAAERELGLELRTVDLRVSELLDTPRADPEDGPGGSGGPGGPDAPPASAGPGDGAAGSERPSPGSGGPATRAAAAVLATPGVARLAPVLGSPLATGGATGRAVRVTEHDEEAGAGAADAERRHVLLQLAVVRGSRALDVARAARAAATGALGGTGTGTGRVTVAVLVTGVDPA